MTSKKLGQFFLALIITTGCIFSGWPEVWLINEIGTSKIQVLQEINKAQAAAPAGQWWNTSFAYRQKITVTAGSTTAPTGYTTNIIIDHATLVTNGKSLSSGNDMRIAYWNGSGWVELDRVLLKGSNWNISTTTILFKTQAEITASSNDDNYYLYYGNSGADTPPTNANNVYDFYEDFSGDLSQWTIDSENTDKVSISSSAGNPSPSLRHDPDSSQTKNSYFDTRLITTNYKMQNGVIEYDVYLAGSSSSAPRIIHQFGFRVNSLSFTNGYCWRLQNSAADAGNLKFASGAWSPFGTAYPAATGNAWHSIKEVVNGSSYTGYVDSGSAYSGTDSTKLTADYLISHVHGVSLTTSSYVLVDNIRVRKYVSPEPTTSYSAEEQFTITQSAYRFFNNLDSTDVGSALAAQDTATTLGSVGATFRLRMLLHITGGLPINGQQFKLQFVGEGTGTCTAPSGGTPSTYTDVTAATVIAYKDNTTPIDGSTLTANADDPIHSTDTIVNQTYEELNNFTNSVAAISSTQDGKWDFALYDNNATADTTYCLRAVKSDGTVLNTYTVYPEITTTSTSPNPVVSNVQLNGQGTINLTESTTTSISATANVSDPQGCSTLSNVTAKIYRSGVSGAEACTPAFTNCYSVASCTQNSCSGTDATYTCNINMQFFADPTDTGTPWDNQYWKAWIQATDGNSNTGSAYNTNGSPEVNSLLGFTVTSTISYGNFDPGSSSTTLDKQTIVTATGNVSLDINLYGVSMTSGGNSIVVGQQRYSLSASTAYASGTQLLVTPGADADTNICKNTSTTKETKDIWWGIAIPDPQPTGTYTGSNTFSAVKNAWSAPGDWCE